MIYNCFACNRRINERKDYYNGILDSADGYDNMNNRESIGKHLLYNHKAFCSDYCIEIYKKHPRMQKQDPNISGWEGTCNNNTIRYIHWKDQRKIDRNKKLNI